MNDLRSTALVLLLIVAVVQAHGQTTGLRSPNRGSEFDNQYLTISISPGWNIRDSGDQKLNLVHGRYLLSINPVFTHASGATCGRFEDHAGSTSVEAVLNDVDRPAGGFECAVWPPEQIMVSHDISLSTLYTDKAKSENGCLFPSSGKSVWFGSFACDEGSEGEHDIKLSYESSDIDNYPERGSRELSNVLDDVIAMLKTLKFKPPVVISRVDPRSALPGATVTLYGSGFNVPNFHTGVQFRDFPNTPMNEPIVAADGKSLTFQIPVSLETMSCGRGLLDIAENCVPISKGHVDINDCPPKLDGSTNFCGVPFPPGTYQIWVTPEGSGILSNIAALTVSPLRPTAVSISLLYPNYLVSAGDMISVRGTGFTPQGNTVKIGSAVINDVPSPNGKMIQFKAPTGTGTSLMRGIRIYAASVSNPNGESNAILVWYR